MSRRSDRDDLDLDVEELNVGAWGNPGDVWSRPNLDPPAAPPMMQGPPIGPPPHHDQWSSTTIGRGGAGGPPGPRAASWLQRHVNYVVAGVGAAALLLAVVAVASSGDDPQASPSVPSTTVAPSTTHARPVATAAPSTTEAAGPNPGIFGADGSPTQDDADYRFTVTELPDGYEATSVDVIGADDEIFLPPKPLLFAADGTSWQTGPWLLVSTSREFGPAVAFPFERPPLAFTLGDLEAEFGRGHDGVEVTAFEADGTSVSIAARGLDPFTTAAVAAQVSISADGVAVPDAALPSGLRARNDIDMTAWEWQWVPGTRTTVSYGNGRDGWMSFNVRARDSAPEVFATAPYVLADVRYAVVGNGTGIAGTYTPAYASAVNYVIWQVPDREYVATGTGMTVDELIAAAASIVQTGDPDWRTALWDDLRSSARACCDDTGEPSDVSLPAEVPTASVDESWVLQASTRDGGIEWDGRLTTNQNDFLAVQTAVGAPLLRVTTRPRWLGMPTEFPAAAVALVDRSMVGSVLRLTTTGTDGQTLEVPLQPVDNDGLAPYLAGAVVLPWTDGGFVAQLLAPDGQTIAVQTDADLA